ncbi:GNAT family N-acetyltransferase [Amycolatopsis japonica]|uniref:GNAT family N-acetyltransferase n=1 Tax=Amycolatopsis japonica TaxID=208439 RepID=UPI00366CF2E2
MFDTVPPEDSVMRPSRTPAAPARCPWGCDLSLSGVTAGYSHWYGTGSFTCLACRNTGEPHAGEWITINPAVQKRPGEVNGLKIALVVLPPQIPAGLGQIQLVHHREVFGYVELSLCPKGCGRAVVQYLEVAESRRRRGVGRVLVEAVRTRCATFTITTAPLPSEPGCVRFWSQIGILGPQDPRPCGHQADAGIAGSRGWEDDARRANMPS